jgi:phospholipase/carboxylesterase
MAEGEGQVEQAAAAAGSEAVDALLALLDVLAGVSRAMHPPRLMELVGRVREPAAALRASEATLDETVFRDAAALTMRACDGLAAAVDAENPLMEAYRAMRLYQRALSTLLPLEHHPAVSRFLLPADQRDDLAIITRLTARQEVDTGLYHHNNELAQRGGVSIYVPPFYVADRVWPLVMALHGGAGHGRLFLSNWVPFARACGLIVVAPTAVGSTWSLMEPEVDSGNLADILSGVSARWRIDRTRMLLTGMSDGGTFTLLSGLDVDSPFTHLGPVAASFHPMLLAMAEPGRLTGLPVYLVHGALDWMFPVSVGRTAARTLAAAGAAVVYRELADLSHAYPADEQPAMLEWFLTASSNRAAA